MDAQPLWFRPTVQAWLRQFSRFALVGASGAVVDFGVYLLLTRGSPFWAQHFVVASSISSLTAATNNFFWNRRFTFQGSGQALVQQYVRYLGVTVLYLAFIQVGLWVLVQQAHLYDVLAKALVLGVAVLIYFTTLRRYIFVPRPPIE